MAAHNVHVVIVGGGLAGLGAAKVLCDSGNFKVVLLEADTVVGGRVKTDYLPDRTPIPLGATSFHGRKGNSLLSYAKSEGLAASAEVEIDDDCVLHTFSEGKVIANETVERVEERVWEIMDVINVCFKKGDWSSFDIIDNKSGVPSIKAPAHLDLRDFIRSQMGSVFEEDSDSQCESILDGILAYEGITEGCKGLRGIDLASFGVWSYLDECTDLIFKDNPFHKIVDSLKSKIPEHVIKVCKEVTTIEWSRQQCTDCQSKIIVQCTDGSEYKTDHVIYTCSLGVLKHACLSGTFVPSLPAEKLTAIKEVGMSLVNKVFLQFDGPLLSGEDYDQFRFYWSDENKACPLVSSNRWALGFQFLRILPNEADKYIYHTFFVGEDAAMIEELPEQKVGETLTQLLHVFLGPNIPQLIAIKVTRWSDSYTRGSYSYTPQGTSLNRREELGNPVNEGRPLQILFGGEATSIDQFGCAHSAYDTGIREAKRLMNYYEEN